MTSSPETELKVRRGDLLLVELDTPYTTSKGDRTKTERELEYKLVVVTGLTRDGKIREVRDDRWGASDYQGVPEVFDRMLYRTGKYFLLPASSWDVAEAKRIAHEHVYPDSTTPMCFKSLEAAREALRPTRLTDSS